MYGQPAMICSNIMFTCMVKEPSLIETFTLSGYRAKLYSIESLTILESKLKTEWLRSWHK
jgi:hypothetical protein